ncbi:unnamed protein product, partial [Dibothriocephalus latus]
EEEEAQAESDLEESEEDRDEDEPAPSDESADSDESEEEEEDSDDDQEEEEPADDQKELDSRCLYVSPIPPNCTFDMLKGLSPKMTCCRFVLKPHSNAIRSYAFCEYADADTAAKEKVNLSGRLFCGKSVRVEQKSTRPEEEASGVDQLDFTRLLVSGLLPSVTASDLRTVFPSASDICFPTAPSTGASLGRHENEDARFELTRSELAKGS